MKEKVKYTIGELICLREFWEVKLNDVKRTKEASARIQEIDELLKTAKFK